MMNSETENHPSFTEAYGNIFVGALRLIAFFVMMAALVPCCYVGRVISKRDPLAVQRTFYRALMRVMGFRIVVHGTVSTRPSTLFVANHTSYLDIPVLGAITPASFVAKAEVSNWPLIGYLSRLLKTIFIERRSTQIDNQRNHLRQCLEEGRSLILFPEGTSSDGLRALPFKSSLFSIVEAAPADKPMVVQPVSVTCTGVGGLPMASAWRAHYAWYGDMTLVGHLWNVFKVGGYRIDVIYHSMVNASDFSNRKTLSAYCHQQVARGIEASLKGREDELLLKGVEMRQLPSPT